MACRSCAGSGLAATRASGTSLALLLRWYRNPSEECVMLEGLFQPLHQFVVLVVVLVIFGPSRLPELGESLGRAIHTCKKRLEEPKPLASPKADDQITDETK